MNTAIRLFSVIVALNGSILSHAAQYSFSRVHTGPVNPGVAINDNGLVALSNGSSLITTDGHTSTVIAGPVGPNYLAWDPFPRQCFSINDNGFVAFRARVDHNMTILASNGTTTRTIAVDNFFSSGNPPFRLSSNSAISINDGGMVAFEASDDGVWGLYVGDGTGDAQLVRSGISQVPAINNAGTIAYRALTTEIQILKGSDPLSLGVSTQVFMPDINDSDIVAVIAGEHQIAVGDGTSSPTYIDGSSYAILSSGIVYDLGDPSLAINNQGVVAFGAYTDTLGGTYGLFVGSDPAADKVIIEADLLDGVAVESLHFSRGGLNNRGQIAFVASLSDGTSGVFVATPIPEPSTFVLLAIGTISLLGFIWRRKGYKGRINGSGVFSLGNAVEG